MLIEFFIQPRFLVRFIRVVIVVFKTITLAKIHFSVGGAKSVGAKCGANQRGAADRHGVCPYVRGESTRGRSNISFILAPYQLGRNARM